MLALNSTNFSTTPKILKNSANFSINLISPVSTTKVHKDKPLKTHKFDTSSTRDKNKFIPQDSQGQV